METYVGCLVEEFIEGREFTVLASDIAPSLDPVVLDTNEEEKTTLFTQPINVMAYDPVECIFREGEDFKHHNLKWVDFEK